jgi:hypothetical protein
MDDLAMIDVELQFQVWPSQFADDSGRQTEIGLPDILYQRD